MTARTVIMTINLIVLAFMLARCAGSPKATAQYYLRDKPQEERVPVSNQADPAGAPIAPIE